MAPDMGHFLPCAACAGAEHRTIVHPRLPRCGSERLISAVVFDVLHRGWVEWECLTTAACCIVYNRFILKTKPRVSQQYTPGEWRSPTSWNVLANPAPWHSHAFGHGGLLKQQPVVTGIATQINGSAGAHPLWTGSHHLGGSTHVCTAAQQRAGPMIDLAQEERPYKCHVVYKPSSTSTLL